MKNLLKGGECAKFTISLIVAMLFFVTMPLSGQVSFGNPEKINDNWLFNPGDVEDFRTVDRQRWQKVELPHDWSIKMPLSATLAGCTDRKSVV